MGRRIFIVGQSGSGKSTSLKYLDPKTSLIINADHSGGEMSFDQKSLGFDTNKMNYLETNSIPELRKVFQMTKKELRHIKVIAIDTYTRMLNDITMGTAFQSVSKDYKKRWGDFAFEHYNLFTEVKQDIPDDVNVYFFCHPETYFDEETEIVRQRISVPGQKLKSIALESFSTTVLYAGMKVKSGEVSYGFHTRNSGFNTCKTPIGMFEEDFIENNLQEVDTAIRKFYNQ
jgi:ABC-type oligopeptide transport system ATPase subunit